MTDQPAPFEPTHVDDWLDNEANQTAHPIAHAFLEAFRRPAIDRLEKPYPGKLFCTHAGKRYQVVGCSRMGDVWLHSGFGDADKQRPFYEHRVDIDGCSDWSDQP